MDSATDYYPYWENQELKRILRELWDRYQKDQKIVEELLLKKQINFGRTKK